MAKYNTGNALGSADPRDLLDNSQIADHYVSDTENTTWQDRFGNARKTWKGIETDAANQLAAEENSFQQFLLNSGYEILADYTDGPITFERRSQITAYNGEYYRPKASVTLPYTTTGNTATTWAADESNFVAVGDAALRQELASSSGFGYIGQVDSIAALRELAPDSDRAEYLLRGHTSGSTIGHGTFYYDASDTTTEDNDCTVVVTTSGARLKRKGVSDKIFMEWAGVLTVDQTDDYQDDALDNCIKAASVGSTSGYCCRQIIGPLFGRVRLKAKHYIRGGIYALAFGAGVLSSAVDGSTGVTGRFVMEKGAGFYVAQTIGAVIDLHVDNYGAVADANQPDLGVTSGVDYVLRCEAYNQGININIEAQGYAGNILYSLGTGATSENTAHWPDLTDDYQGLNNLTNGSYNIRNCGRTFNVSNSLSGVGQMGSVWEQWNSGSSLFNGVADVSFIHYETTVPYNAAARVGSLIFNNCGKLSFKELNVGSGGKPLCAFNNCSSVQIANYYAIHGETYGVSASNFMIGMEVANSVVQLGTMYLSGSVGIPFCIGKGGSLSIGGGFASNVNCLAVLCNQPQYLTTFADSTSSPTWKNFGKLYIGEVETQYMNRSSLVVSARPSILVESDMQNETLVKINGWRNLFPHNGFSSAADMYYVQNNSNFADIQLEASELPNSPNPLYMRQPYNLSKLKNCTMTGKIIFSSGDQSISGGAKFYKATGDQITPSNSITNSSNVPMGYYMLYKVSSGGSVSLSKNGYGFFQATTEGNHSVAFILLPGETVTASYDTSLVTVQDYNTSYNYS